jgi:uncharacterized protein
MSIVGIATVLRAEAGIGNAASPRPADERLGKLLKHFEYDRSAPLNVEEKFLMKTGGYSQYHLLFDSTNGERVPASLFLPVKPAPPFPCIIVQHGYGGDKSMGGTFASVLIPRGYAVIAIDIEYHGERKEAGKDVLSTDIEDDARALSQTVVDLMRTVDYLASRGDIDMNGIGYIGASLGSFLGAVFAGVDERVKSVFLIVGGGDWEKMLATSKVGPFDGIRDLYKQKGLPYSDYDKRMDAVEPLNYIGLVSPRPLLMVNCSNDKYVPKENAEELYDAAKDPKKIEWYTCDGDIAHIPPMDKTLSLIKKWFKKTLGK